MLTFEKDPFLGTQSILEKLTVRRPGGIWLTIHYNIRGPLTKRRILQNLPFQKVQHRVDTTDAQPSNEQGGILVMVTGALLVDDQQHPMSYVQTFNLHPEGGSYFVFNDIFRLVYAASG
ncbi:uncharacterized protein PV07_00576 [Cladophialophora immunda]|uniref:NTF2 domain-containing protein n=1 Tax=Cladophialophora immunda TaxID=569365 RepID=A0A0D2B7Z2_9EURO|nr:uncharacterized protein PV07_00576 [Cladophialophora immunda]KIW33752.1 hypothetical protein PV07_00576 [Cladophialophora immunda]